MKKFEWFGWVSGLMLMIVGSPTFAICQDGISEKAQMITNSIGMALVPISAGRFTMGSPASERGSQEDEVLHKVDITQPFHLGATEVTEHQWAMVMEEPFWIDVVEIRDPDTKRLVKKEERQIKNPKLDSQLPIAGISWSQAVEFCKRLGDLPEEKKEGRNYRLPTEAEWEYACRAGTSTAYCFGDDATMLNDYAWHQGNGEKVMPVAGKQPNAWGLHDMHGNVFEWCFDLYDNYPETLVVDPYGPEIPEKLRHVARSGSAETPPIQVRSGFREKLYGKGKLTGFRVVLGAKLKAASLEEFTNSIGQRLIRIPAGTFKMGRNDDGDIKFGAGPAHDVVLSHAFFCSTTEVTQGEWKAVMKTEPWKGRQDVTEGSRYAASYITWDDAVEFCRRLSAMEGERSAKRAYRLPTEAEWEYACRANNKSDHNFGGKFKFGYDDPTDHFAWHRFSQSSHRGPQAVAQKEPNYWGLYDMHGNVWEWCSDWYGEYPSGTTRDPVGPPTGTKRVNRGGSWEYEGLDCSAVVRGGPGFVALKSHHGFRVVCDATSN